MLHVLLFTSITIPTIFIIFHLLRRHLYTRWLRRGLPQLSPRFPTGDIPRHTPENLGLTLNRWYRSFKSLGHPIGGVYMHLTPMCLLVSPTLIKRVLAEDFVHFTDHGNYYNERADPLSAHLFLMGGERWRMLRKKMVPTFSAAKMRGMFGLLKECAERLVENVEKQESPLDIKELFSRYATDTIGSCAFGLDCNSIADDDAPFRRFGRKVFQSSFLKVIKRHVRYSFPLLADLLGLRFVDKDVADFFVRTVEDTMTQRKQTGSRRGDFMQLLMGLREDPGLTTVQVASQAFGFFIAGFETSSILMTYCLYELAVNLDVQEKARREVQGCWEKHQEFSYDCLQEMKYSKMVLDETLRKYPPFMFLNRQCTKECVFPDLNLRFEVGDRLLIPIYALHHDEELFPDPDAFRPERFEEPIPEFAYLPFGDGPRKCIGIKFGMMQSLLALAVLLQRYRFELHPKTQLPLGVTAGTVISPRNTVYVAFGRA